MYDFKWFEETAWFAIVAAITYIGGVAVVGMPSDHWKVWAMTVIAGASRAAVAVVVSRVKAAPTVTPPPMYVPPAVFVPSAWTDHTTTAGTVTTTTGSTYTTEPSAVVAPQTPPATLPDHAGTLPRPQAVAPTSVSPTV